jgi:hypothetical protein
MNVALDQATSRKIDWMVGELSAEFAGRFDRTQIEEVMDDSVERLAAGASVLDFVPLMAYRFTRERLRALEPLTPTRSSRAACS